MQKPNADINNDQISPLEIKLAWILRSLIIFTIIIHIYFGAWLYSILCLLALIIIMIPPFLARTNRVNLPFEIELFVLWWLVVDMTFGRLLGLYDASIWYDKIIHFGNSGLLGLIAFLAIYTLNMTGKIRTGYIINILAIFLVTLGLGALWEILEYVTDSILHGGTQGSPLMAPLSDTMWDLILDGAGGIAGGLLGSWYMSNSSRSLVRWKTFMDITSKKSLADEPITSIKHR